MSTRAQLKAAPSAEPSTEPQYDPSSLDRIPVAYHDLIEYFQQHAKANPYALRKETFLRIERTTRRPLICYVAKTNNVSPQVPTGIDNGDLTGFGDLARSVEGEAVDVFIVSNGGSAEAAERVVQLLRERFTTVRFIVPANAYSAATLLCFAGDELIMDSLATLGPIDPQVNGIPARAILRGFEAVQERLKNEDNPRALTAYVPLLQKYDLYLLEICKSAQDLSKELAHKWLCTYMLKRPEEDMHVAKVVEFFSSYDIHKSHGRSIDRGKTRELLGETVTYVENIAGLADLVRSLRNQYEFFFDRVPFYKVFENAHGVSWGRKVQQVQIQVEQHPPTPVPQPGTPERTP